MESEFHHELDIGIAFLVFSYHSLSICKQRTILLHQKCFNSIITKNIHSFGTIYPKMNKLINLRSLNFNTLKAYIDNNST